MTEERGIHCSKCSNLLPKDTPLGDGNSCPFCGDKFATLRYEEKWIAYPCDKCGEPLDYSTFSGTGEGGPYDGWELAGKCKNCGTRNTYWTH